MADNAYRAFVERIAQGSARPSEIILNRSPDHAAIIYESLFAIATGSVKIVTDTLMPRVYGSERVVSRACEFLRAHQAGTIDILAESNVDRNKHPFLVALDNAGYHDRVSLRFVPPAVRATYGFNFAVVDKDSYRFEESRETSEAIIQFRDGEFAASLDVIFAQLRESSVSALPL